MVLNKCIWIKNVSYYYANGVAGNLAVIFSLMLHYWNIMSNLHIQESQQTESSTKKH